MVADAVAQAVEKGWVHRTVPRRYGLVGALYPVFGRPMRWGLRRFEAQAKKKLHTRKGKGLVTAWEKARGRETVWKLPKDTTSALEGKHD